LKEFRLAREFAEKAHAIYLRVYGPKHSYTIDSQGNLADLLKAERDPEFAKAKVSDSRLCSMCNKVCGCL
jgi:hypothetical protein